MIDRPEGAMASTAQGKRSDTLGIDVVMKLRPEGAKVPEQIGVQILLLPLQVGCSK